MDANPRSPPRAGGWQQVEVCCFASRWASCSRRLRCSRAHDFQCEEEPTQPWTSGAMTEITASGSTSVFPCSAAVVQKGACQNCHLQFQQEWQGVMEMQRGAACYSQACCAAGSRWYQQHAVRPATSSVGLVSVERFSTDRWHGENQEMTSALRAISPSEKTEKCRRGRAGLK